MIICIHLICFLQVKSLYTEAREKYEDCWARVEEAIIENEMMIYRTNRLTPIMNPVIIEFGAGDEDSGDEWETDQTPTTESTAEEREPDQTSQQPTSTTPAQPTTEERENQLETSQSTVELNVTSTTILSELFCEE